MLLNQTIKSIDLVRVKSDKAILFCSFGKDSLVLLDLLSKQFGKIECVFMYFVKDLEHVNKFIRWAKAKYKNIEIHQIPHWNLTYIKRSGLYCVPDPKIRLLKLSDIDKAIRLKFGINYVFYGMKKADSLNRRLMLNTYENNENKGKVYPLADWKQKDILAYMKQNKLPEPVRYSKKASGGLGFNEECFLWLRDNHPQDLEKMYSVFPMSRRILYEYDNKTA